MGQTLVEVESKFDIDDSFTLPDLTGLPGVARVDPPMEHQLKATYLDTAVLGLLRGRITLRRRTGGTDAGWHLKLPSAGGARLEVHRPLGRSARVVPAQLADLVGVRAGGQALVPVVRLSTRRRVHVLRSADGTELAQVCDDHVRAEVLQTTDGGEPASVLHWRELEVELVNGDRDLLKAAARALGKAGAQPASSVSKVGRALTARLAALPEKGAGAAGTARRKPKTAGDVLLGYLAAQVEELKDRDPQVRLDVEDSVHRMRVATRRLRSALALRPIVDRTVAEPLRAELKWLGSVLGNARDAEVMRERLLGAIHGLPGELVVGPVAARMQAETGPAYATAHADVVTVLDGTRYASLIFELEAMLAVPPFTDRADADASEELPALLRRQFNRTRRALRAAEAVDGEEHDHLLHEVRKAAKRARYAGEAVEPALGEPAKQFAGAMEDMQESLGAHQDSVVTRQLLIRMAATAQAHGESAFTYGVLHGAEAAAASREEARLPRLWRAARKASRRMRP